jgi:segregation and condensation protein A
MEPLSVRERMSLVLQALEGGELVPFQRLFTLTEGRPGVVVSFLAVLELLRNAAIEIVQAEPLSPIYLRAV